MRDMMMNEMDGTVQSGSAPLNSFSESEYTPRWVWFVLFAIIVAELVLIWWYAKQKMQVSAVQQELNQEIALQLHRVVERRDIKRESFISGRVKAVAADSITLSVVNAPKSEYRVLLNRQTKLYRLSNDTIPKRITLTLNDITTDSVLTVISNEEIGDKNIIQAIEIVKIQ